MIKKLICLFFHRKQWRETGEFGNEESDYTCLKCLGFWYINNKTGRVRLPKFKFWYNYDVPIYYYQDGVLYRKNYHFK